MKPLNLATNYWRIGCMFVRLAVKAARRGDFLSAEGFIIEAQFKFLDAQILLQP